MHVSRKNRTIEIMHRMEVGSAILNILINLVEFQSSSFPPLFIVLACGLTSHSNETVSKPKDTFPGLACTFFRL